MKIFAVIVTLILIVGCAHLSDNSSAVNIDGTWRGEIKLGILTGIRKPGGPFKRVPPRIGTTYVFFNFKREGDTVNGTVSGQPGEWIPLEDIKIKGKKISFTVTSMKSENKAKIKYTGKIEGEKIKLSYIIEMLGTVLMPGTISIPGTVLMPDTVLRPGPVLIPDTVSKPGSLSGAMNSGMGSNKNTSGNQAGLSMANGVSDPVKPYPTFKVTLERISKIPENPVN